MNKPPDPVFRTSDKIRAEPRIKSELNSKSSEPRIKSELNSKSSGRKMKSIHQLLTPTRNPNGVILNRDRNACQNILDILKEFLWHRTRPQAFCRQQRLVS